MRAVVLAVLLLLAPAAASAQTVVEGTLALGGKVVSLPPGPWRVLYRAAEPSRTTELTTPTTMHRAVLVQERGGVAAAVIVAAAAAEVGTAWHPHGICVNTNALQRQVESAVYRSLDCRGLVNIGSGRGQVTPSYLNALYDEGVQRPGWIPVRWISAQVLLSEGMHYLSVDYRFAPSAFAPAAASGGSWNEGVRNAAQQGFIDRLAGWSARARTELQRGLYGRAPTAPLPSPF